MTKSKPSLEIMNHALQNNHQINPFVYNQQKIPSNIYDYNQHSNTYPSLDHSNLIGHTLNVNHLTINLNNGGNNQCNNFNPQMCSKCNCSNSNNACKNK